VRSKKDLIDLGKKMTVDKGEMYRYLLCENPSLMKRRKKRKKNSRNER